MSTHERPASGGQAVALSRWASSEGPIGHGHVEVLGCALDDLEQFFDRLVLDALGMVGLQGLPADFLSLVQVGPGTLVGVVHSLRAAT